MAETVQDRGGLRGRRRRGRGGRRGERTMPESKYARPAAPAPAAELTTIMARRRDMSRSCFRENPFPNTAVISPQLHGPARVENANPSLAATFPDDEPVFAKEPEEVVEEHSFAAPAVEDVVEETHAAVVVKEPEEVHSYWGTATGDL